VWVKGTEGPFSPHLCHRRLVQKVAQRQLLAIVQKRGVVSDDDMLQQFVA
jgi:hypothetical protein